MSEETRTFIPPFGVDFGESKKFDPNLTQRIPSPPARASEGVIKERVRAITAPEKPHPLMAMYQELTDCMAGRNESDIPISDEYWKIKNRIIVAASLERK